jgi:hypothetical protein
VPVGADSISARGTGWVRGRAFGGGRFWLTVGKDGYNRGGHRRRPGRTGKVASSRERRPKNDDKRISRWHAEGLAAFGTEIDCRSAAALRKTIAARTGGDGIFMPIFGR